MQKKTLVLITEQFPYGHSETFLETEIPYLADAFEAVHILPSKKSAVKRLLPENVIVDDSFSSYYNSLNENRKLKFLKGIFTVLVSRGYYQQVRMQPGRYLHPIGFKRMAIWARESEILARYFREYIDEHNLDTENTLFYTYWFHLATVALGKSLKRAKVISRAHGYDLYDERGEPPYSNWKCMGLKYLEKLFLISEDGLYYMNRLYPEYSEKYEVSRLGVHDPKMLSKASKDGCFWLISVAGVKKVKRMHLIVSALRNLAGQYPNLNIRWDHFGDGPMMDVLKQQVQDEINDKADVTLHGMVPNREVMGFYKSNPVDLFINVSSSEGIPVSIMEAQSFGVPVMATDVGGTSEIVNHVNGVLLSEHATAQEVAENLTALISDQTLLYEKRKQSRISWEKMYNAERNYTNFAKRLSEI